MRKHISPSTPNKIPAEAVYNLLVKVHGIGTEPAVILKNAKSQFTFEDFEQGVVKTLPRDQFTILYRECILALEAHANQRSGRLSMELNETRLLYHCIISCHTLRDAIVRSGEFFEMLDRGIKVRLEVSGNVANFTMATRRRRKDSASFLSDLVGLSSFHQFYGWLIGQHIDLLEVYMAYDTSFESDIFIDFFQIPVKLDGAANMFTMNAAFLERPVIRSYNELEKLLETFPLDIMPPDYKTGRISDHVRKIIYNALLSRADLPRIPDLAVAFNLSNATLRRRLAEEESSINAIKQSCRRQLAEELLRDDGETIQSIAGRLGFSDATSFRRAFKKWTGIAPSKYRAPANAFQS